MKNTLLWIGALVVGAVLGVLGLNWLNALMDFIATVYTRLFQLLAVPTIVLAVITTFATFGSKGSGKIFGRTVLYTLLTTFAAAVVGAVLYMMIAPSNLPQIGEANVTEMLPEEAQKLLPSSDKPVWMLHLLNIIPNNIVKPFLEGNVLSLLLLAFAIGIGLSKLPESENKAVVVKGLLGLQELLFLLIRGLIWTLPLGIVAFSAQLSAQVSTGIVADSIGKYVLVVPIGTRSESHSCAGTHDACRTDGSLHQEQRRHPTCDDGVGGTPVRSQEQHRPLRSAHLYHHQHERLCSLHPCHFAFRHAKWRYATHAGHHPTVDLHFRLFSHRQCRRPHGLLFPDVLTDVGHRCSYRHLRHHPAHLHYHRHGGNGRECMVGLLCLCDDRPRFKRLIRLLMHAFHSTATGVVHVTEGGIPLKGNGC